MSHDDQIHAITADINERKEQIRKRYAWIEGIENRRPKSQEDKEDVKRFEEKIKELKLEIDLLEIKARHPNDYEERDDFKTMRQLLDAFRIPQAQQGVQPVTTQFSKLSMKERSSAGEGEHAFYGRLKKDRIGEFNLEAEMNGITWRVPSTRWKKALEVLEAHEEPNEVIVRQLLEKDLLALSDGKWERRLCNHDIDRVLGSRRPRADVYNKEDSSPATPAFVIFTGEFKTYKKLLDDDAKGQALLQALHLFRVQENRKKAFVFLSNGKQIIYFKVESIAQFPRPEDDLDFRFFQSKTFNLHKELSDGLQFLMHLMNTPAENLGLPTTPEFEGLEVQRCLGAGATSNVWLVKNADQERVLKVYTQSQAVLSLTKPFKLANLIDSEVKAMKALAPVNQVNLPTFIHQYDDKAILLSPPLLPFRMVTKKKAQQLFAALEFIHTEKKYVHRDIRCDNIMQDVDGNAYLIDFGFAMPVSDEEVRFAGARLTASDRVLTNRVMKMTHFAYTQADDLESLVKTLFICNSPAFGPIPIPDSDDSQGLLDLWQKISVNWKAVLTLARTGNHKDTLAKLEENLNF